MDDQLTKILSSDTNVYIPNATFTITGAVRAEIPVALTGGIGADSRSRTVEAIGTGYIAILAR
ncbi:MAG TPA: hypothetical protein VFO86_07685 [Terriglobia bacterium]|nr:hypothetical protein [Terriglobia bacterium]